MVFDTDWNRVLTTISERMGQHRKRQSGQRMLTQVCSDKKERRTMPTPADTQWLYEQNLTDEGVTTSSASLNMGQ